jgi:flagellin-like protein
MMNFKNEEAVSPVIGVILMVAITVILAAVIAAFVFGMTGNVATTKTVAATMQISEDSIVVTYQGGPDHNAVASLTCSAVTTAKKGGNIIKLDVINASTVEATATPSAESTVSKPKVGHKWAVNLTELREVGGNVVITVTAMFSDGTEQVILDKTQFVPKTESTT